MNEAIIKEGLRVGTIGHRISNLGNVLPESLPVPRIDATGKGALIFDTDKELVMAAFATLVNRPDWIEVTPAHLVGSYLQNTAIALDVLIRVK